LDTAEKKVDNYVVYPKLHIIFYSGVLYVLIMCIFILLKLIVGYRRLRDVLSFTTCDVMMWLRLAVCHNSGSR